MNVLDFLLKLNNIYEDYIITIEDVYGIIFYSGNKKDLLNSNENNHMKHLFILNIEEDKKYKSFVITSFYENS